jgi:rubredoxin
MTASPGPQRGGSPRPRPGPAPAAAARDSANPVRELFDAAAQGYTLRFACRGCGRVRIFHAAAVWNRFDRKGWSPWLSNVPARFVCRVCGRRSPRLELGHDEPTDHSLPLPDRYVWKRELGRRR